MMETQFFYTNHNAGFLGNTWIISTADLLTGSFIHRTINVVTLK